MKNEKKRRRILLKKYMEPYISQWMEAYSNEYYDYFPEQKFFIHEDFTDFSKYKCVGEIPYKDLMLLLFYSWVKKCSLGNFPQDELRERGAKILHAMRIIDKKNFFDFLYNEASCPYNEKKNEEIKNFSSLSIEEKHKKFHSSFPNKYEEWKKLRGRENIKRASEEKLTQLFEYQISLSKKKMYDVIEVEEFIKVIRDGIIANGWELDEKFKELIGKRIYVYMSRYEKESKKRQLIRKIHYSIAWKRFLWWQRHILFNKSLYLNWNDWSHKIENVKDLLHEGKLLLLHLWEKYIHPIPPLIGYHDGTCFFSSLAEKELLSCAMYMFYFGHTVRLSQRRRIREMWKARYLLRRVEKLSESSLSKEVDEQVIRDWNHGISQIHGSVPCISVCMMTYSKDSSMGPQFSEMTSTWIMDVTQMDEEEKYQYMKYDSYFNKMGGVITYDKIKDDVFSSLAVEKGKKYIELNDSYQKMLEDDRNFYYKKWDESIAERKAQAKEEAFKYISEHFEDWWD